MLNLKEFSFIFESIKKSFSFIKKNFYDDFNSEETEVVNFIYNNLNKGAIKVAKPIFVAWIFSLYLKERELEKNYKKHVWYEDILKAKRAFEKYTTTKDFPIGDRLSLKKNGEFNYETINDFFNKIGDLIPETKFEEKINSNHYIDSKEAKVLLDSERFKVLLIDSQKANDFYGEGSTWCTTTENGGLFGNYRREGNIYIIFDRSLANTNNPDRIHQIQFESNQIMDFKDNLSYDILFENEIYQLFKYEIQNTVKSIYLRNRPKKAIEKFFKASSMFKKLESVHITIKEKKEEVYIPSSFFEDNNLESLILDGIKLENNKIPKSIAKWKDLHILEISNSNLKEVPDEIFNLDISEVNFIGNQITKLPKELFEMETLSYARFTNNKIKEVDLNLILNSSIKYLSLSDNEIEYIHDIDTTTIIKPKTSRDIFLVGNKITSIPFDLFKIDKNFYIQLENNYITEIRNIEDIDLVYNNQSLNLEHNPIYTKNNFEENKIKVGNKVLFENDSYLFLEVHNKKGPIRDQLRRFSSGIDFTRRGKMYVFLNKKTYKKEELVTSILFNGYSIEIQGVNSSFNIVKDIFFNHHSIKPQINKIKNITLIKSPYSEIVNGFSNATSLKIERTQIKDCLSIKAKIKKLTFEHGLLGKKIYLRDLYPFISLFDNTLVELKVVGLIPYNDRSKEFVIDGSPNKYNFSNFKNLKKIVFNTWIKSKANYEIKNNNLQYLEFLDYNGNTNHLTINSNSLFSLKFGDRFNKSFIGSKLQLLTTNLRELEIYFSEKIDNLGIIGADKLSKIDLNKSKIVFRSHKKDVNKKNTWALNLQSKLQKAKKIRQILFSNKKGPIKLLLK